jgi:hypothetical protein
LENFKEGDNLRYLDVYGKMILKWILKQYDTKWRSQHCSVGIATGYGLDDRVLNPSRGEIFLFSTKSRQALGSTQPSMRRVTVGSFPGGKAAGE